MDLFTADWHFGHTNIIRYCNRPFANTEEMDTTIIDNINEVAGVTDRIFMLGDVTFSNDPKILQAYRDRIKCQYLLLVPGNHDGKNIKELRKYFTVLPAEYMYKNAGQRIVLSHYAMRVWSGSHHGVGQLYGHSHGSLPAIPGYMAFDVGVDSWNYKPLTFDQVIAEFKRLCPLGKTVVGDHHGDETV